MIIFGGRGFSGADELAAAADTVLEAKGLPRIGKINRDVYGAPSSTAWNISVSHTDGRVLLAVSRRRVGMDCERRDRACRAVAGGIKEWTALEAAGKYSGRGITLSDVKKGVAFPASVRYMATFDDLETAVCGGDDEWEFIELQRIDKPVLRA